VNIVICRIAQKAYQKEEDEEGPQPKYRNLTKRKSRPTRAEERSITRSVPISVASYRTIQMA
jgi:hypothetical protein